MKIKILLLPTIIIFNTSFTMESVKSFFGFNTKKQLTEMQKLNKQMEELANIEKSLIPTISTTLEAYKKNEEKFKFNTKNSSGWMSGYRIGDHSKSINTQGITFDLSEENGTMHFAIKNLLDNAAVLGEFKLDKTLYDDTTAHLLYSHLVDSFDALLLTLDRYEIGFVKDLSDPKTAQEYPTTIAHLKPQPIEQSKSLKNALERLDAVIKAEAILIMERAHELRKTN